MTQLCPLPLNCEQFGQRPRFGLPAGAMPPREPQITARPMPALVDDGNCDDPGHFRQAVIDGELRHQGRADITCHHLREGEEEDFIVRDVKEITEVVSTVTNVMTAFLGAVAAISLLVGSIGIMNIMLVSVTERTREIGIRLAIGARARDVLLQFLIEAVVLSALGGLIGIALGLGLAYAGTVAMGLPFVFEPGIVGVAFSFSLAVGVLFGFFPARRAARLDPIEALRYE